MVGESKIAWNPHSLGYLESPYEHLKACREQNPVQEISNDSWAFFKYSDVNQILSSKDFSVSNFSKFLKDKEPYIFKNSNACPFLSTGTGMWAMYLNDYDHKNARVAISKSLCLDNLEDIMINSVDRVNHKYGKKSNFDLVSYCGEFIFHVLNGILGTEEIESYDKIKTYSNMLARVQDIYIPKQLYLKMNEWLLWGKSALSDSEFRRRLVEFPAGAGLNYNEDEIYSIIGLTIMAAFETSKDNLTVALVEILKDNKLQEYIETCSQQELNILIEELFRFSTPLQYTIRVNKYPIDTKEGEIPKNSKIYLSIASANRDESVFQNANQIVVDRKPNDHLSFGKGVHFCLGATIARLELRKCLKPMVEFLRNYELAGEVKWSRQIFMRTMESALLVRKA